MTSHTTKMTNRNKDLLTYFCLTSLTDLSIATGYFVATDFTSVF